MKYDTENKTLETIREFIDLQGRTVLEIGCGDGQLSKRLSLGTQKYIAIDPDEQRLQKAKFEPSTVDFRVGTGEALEFEDESFSVVLFILSLHHQKSRKALKEAHRVLTEDGQLLVLEPMADGELTRFFNLFDDEADRIEKARNAVEGCDFEIERQDVFYSIMSFDDPDDLVNYPFARDEIRPKDEERILDKLYELRGSCPDDGPIHLHDDSHIFLLRKKRVTAP